jgi:chitinase
MKVLLSVGGGGEACSGNFAAVASDPVTTRNFVLTVKELVDRFGLDGLDGKRLRFYAPSFPEIVA